jgi:hypothetical protein
MFRAGRRTGQTGAIPGWPGSLIGETACCPDPDAAGAGVGIVLIVSMTVVVPTSGMTTVVTVAVNYGQWEIDHKRPCAAFDLTQLSQQA